MSIYFSSDTHFGHDREFIFGPRGFKDINEMNEAIVRKFNAIVSDEDELYLLGDCILGDTEQNIEYLKRLNGKIHIILGNHDTMARQSAYKSLNNILDVKYADMIKIKTENGTFNFYLSHFPTHTANLDDHGELSHMIINLYGHTHQKTNFYMDNPTMYHVGVDSHGCFPVEINDIITDIKNQIDVCQSYL